MDCETCGGTGEIPLLGPNTTSCPDCEWSRMVWVSQLERDRDTLRITTSNFQRDVVVREETRVEIDMEDNKLVIHTPPDNFAVMSTIPTDREKRMIRQHLDQIPYLEFTEDESW